LSAHFSFFLEENGMLLSLTIRNVALIEELTISLHEGFHVLTGETGAGKSIIVDAVNLVLGGRADRELIRTGCEKAYVEALFDIRDNLKIKELLSQQEMDAEDDLLSISREISVSGKNICRVLGMVMPLAFLRDITATLIDVHGQHEHQFLMDEHRHLLFLDSFGDDAHRIRMEAASSALEAYRLGERELHRLTRENSQREQRMDMLRFQLQELKAAKLVAGEEEILRRDLERLRHSVKISAALHRAYENVYAGAGKQLSSLALLKDAVSAMDGISAMDPEYEKLRDKLKDLYYELEDGGLQLRSLSESAAFDPERNEQLEARLDLLRRLERKYGSTVEDMIAYTQKIGQEYLAYQHMDDTLDDMQKSQKKRLAEYVKEAEALTVSRRNLAAWFEKEMVAQLKQLGMEKTQFSVQFLPAAAHDVPEDEVAFLISPNPGEPLKPLSKIASGGELSRLMLAIKSIAAQQGLIPTMVFDEIDTGISGKIAQVVSEKIAMISAYRQVLCVTHLPQIAAMADYHYLVEKNVQGDRTYTNVTELNESMRESELARMVGGSGSENDSGLMHARNLLRASSDVKAQIVYERKRKAINFV
jgi:DNA repair protein RecN (Recombination protein N)